MASLNTPKPTPRTHEGGVARRLKPEETLRRTVLACMLWEDGFYESGVAIADRIKELVPQVEPEKVAALAVEARTQANLRHAPLLLVREMARHEKHKALVAHALPEIVLRPDEITEFLALYWKDGRCPVAASVKKGLGMAFRRFDEYALAKYDRDGPVKLRDALRICHPAPVGPDQAALWKKVVAGTLATPDTWEVALSAGADKKATWERLIAEKKLGALALLRNLRNMRQAGVPDAVVRGALHTMNTARVLPYRFIAAAKHASQMEPELEAAMFRNLEGHAKLAGKTILLVDVSGSMSAPLSAKGDLTRIDAANALAMLLREVCDNVEIIAFNGAQIPIPPRRGFALRDAVMAKFGGSTKLGAAVAVANVMSHDRLVVISDEQTEDKVPDPVSGRAYMLNVASSQNGVGYGRWTNITGFSESVVDYIVRTEANE